MKRSNASHENSSKQSYTVHIMKAEGFSLLPLCRIGTATGSVGRAPAVAAAAGGCSGVGSSTGSLGYTEG